MNGTRTKTPPPARRTWTDRVLKIALLLLAVTGVAVGIVTIGILVKGRRTKAYPSVVHLSGPYCSGVAIRPDVILTAEHCQTAMGSHIWDGEGQHVGTAAEPIAECRNGLAVLRVKLDGGQILLPIAPDDSDLKDGASTTVVGFGAWPLRVKFYAVGSAYDATCPGCADPRGWKARLTSGLACKGDSGGAGFTAAGVPEKLAGIIEGAAGNVTMGCASEVVFHRLDAAAMKWVDDSIATYSGTPAMTCP